MQSNLLLCLKIWSLISFISLPLASENLLDIYNEALDNDPQYKSSEYSLLAGKEFVVQGRAGLLPNVTLMRSTNWNEYYQFDELQSAYNNNSVTARLTQPLFRLDSWFNFKRSKNLRMLLKLTSLMRNKI